MRPASAGGESGGRRILLWGISQGVGLRPLVHRLARSLGVTGRAINVSSGLEIEAFGPEAALDALVAALRDPATATGRIEGLRWEPITGPAPDDFRLGARSTARDATEAGDSIALSPDVALCTACRAELEDARDRRFRHPFVSCTACGPRVTIATALPWERAHTTMSGMALCPRCREEFEHPEDRRHHAETIACPDCGPRLAFERTGPRAAETGDDPVGDDDALRAAADLLRRGAIVAVRGIGGYHLACRADDAAAVARLRKAKRRPRKPFAVMVADLAAAERLAVVDDLSRGLLESRAAPIVLLERRPDASIAEEIAPDLPWIGLMLAYSPLHVLLLESVGAPLVMTSGNASGEPIACTRDEARRRLAPLVDALLHHDRAITVPAEDSVVLPIGAHALMVRRSRGHVPAALRGPIAAPEPILAFGAQLANTVCIARGGRLHPSEHVGDLESPEALERQAAAIARIEAWLGVRCEIVAHDLHPGYTSTQAARRREATLRIAVQHHHAHVVSALVELGRTDPVVGIAFDGTGAGTDGAAWGGEVLLVRPDRFERLATLRPLPLLGGETAIREVWRLALAMLEDAFGDDAPLDAFPVFRQVERDRLDAARALARSDFPLVAAHGAGRWFDAFGALFLDRAVATHSGEIAMHWNAAADPAEDRAYPFSLAPPADTSPATGHTPHLSVDLREAVRAAVADRLAGRAAASISARFHATLAAATAAVLERERAAIRGCPVVLTGGCFQNALLTRRVADALGVRHAVHRHEQVPPGDGGISIGQALVASAVARAGGGDAHLRGEGA